MSTDWKKSIIAVDEAALEGLRAQILEDVRAAERGNRARVLSGTTLLAHLLAEIGRKPWGGARIHGGGVAKAYGYPATSTFLKVCWWRKGSHIIVRWQAWRGPAPNAHSVFRRDFSRREVWEMCFPDFAKRAQQRAVRTALRRVWGEVPPLPPGAVSVPEIRRYPRVAIVASDNGHRYLVAPGLPPLRISGWERSIAEACWCCFGDVSLGRGRDLPEGIQVEWMLKKIGGEEQ